MEFKVDPAFEGSGQRAKERQRARTLARALTGLGCVVVVALFILAGFRWSRAPEIAETTLDDFQIVQVEEAVDTGIRVDPLASFIHLPRDPMILRLPKAQAERTKRIAGPAGFAPRRAGPPSTERLAVLRDALVVSASELVTALPSTRDDFALFDAKRRSVLAGQSQTPQNPVPAGQLVSAEGGSWGDLIKEEAETESVYLATYLEDPASNLVTWRENRRQTLFEDEIVVLQTAQTLEEVLRAKGLASEETAMVVKATARELAIEGTLAQGSVVALRLAPSGSPTRFMQMSIYGPDAYLASLAQIGAGRFVQAADPWQEADLLRRSGKMRAQARSRGDVRLLDALYSAAIRNGLPTRLVGELMVIMSQRFDLDRFAAEGDEITLIYAAAPGAMLQGLGGLLYAGISGPSGEMPCYVLPAQGTSGYECFDFQAPPSGQGGAGGHLIVPVRGVTTSGFGPRLHPILKQVRKHNGVDWRAPIGTPVHAAAKGTIALAGNGGGYGNVVYIDHANGRQTRYAHLNGFAPGLTAGKEVAQGELIGFVGTTGRSTGPHLHFELHLNGAPVDPLGYLERSLDSGTQAVEALVNQIIRVESAGVATAKNPRSTATGLGQFINSTWLRMMRDYRPDLVRQMSRSELLALRTDPTLSRQMVKNLARENESYLRRRGHSVTPGRLYLAHFLGPAGADLALRADGRQSVGAVMGANVVSANPFLRGKTIADLRAWSDRKMGGAGAGVPPQTKTPAAALPADVLAYRAAVDGILARQ